MASGYTISSSLAELIPEITLEAAYIYQNKAIARSLVTVAEVSGRPGLTVEFPRFTEVAGDTAFTNEYDSPTSHAMDLTMPTLTIVRRSVFVLLGDLAKKGSSGDIVGNIGRAMGMAMAKQDDAGIFGVVTGTTNWTTGTGVTNAAFAIGYVLDGLLLLEKNEVDDQLYCVLHPHQYDPIRDTLTPVANDDGISIPQAGEMVRSAFVSRMFGAEWFLTNRIGSGTVTATASVYNGLLFAKQGIGYAFSWLEVPGIESERTAEAASTKLIINYADSAGVIYGSAVCKLYSTSS
jgi:hypothetical protein